MRTWIWARALALLSLPSMLWALNEEKKKTNINIAVVFEKANQNYLTLMKKAAEDFTELSILHTFYSEGEDIESYDSVCKQIKDGLGLLVDMTWKGWSEAQSLAKSFGIPYVRVDVTNRQFVQAADDYLQNRNASDAALIFPSEGELDQALLYLIGNSIIRMLVLDNINNTVADNLKKMRPMPSNYIIYGDADQIRQMFETANRNQLTTRDAKWVLVFQNFAPSNFGSVEGTLSKIVPDPKFCCSLLKYSSTVSPGECKCQARKIPELFLEMATKILGKTVRRAVNYDNGMSSVSSDCNEIKKGQEPSNQNNKTFYEHLQQVIVYDFTQDARLKDKVISAVYTLNIDDTVNKETHKKMGQWTSDSRFILDPSQANETIKRFLKIGIALTRPFTFIEKTDAKKNKVYDGFCIRLLEKIAEIMNFEYEYVPAPNNLYGNKHENGTWDGLIGDLVNGVTDIVIAALTMTSEREEAVDFVAPHFDQSGISIVMRKPEREVSLFKFMSVLEPEVWWCILAAIVVTAVVLWLLDKYSPFSGQNKKRYPYDCRKFTLVECFWFALTSITPQGGGEPPKAVSGRILVAAYWLFVVLMLATFTANLAAFLTVERMQSPVRSLEELAKQSKINYTVVKDSSIEQYFVNMAGAEDELYRVWKDITLNTSNDQAKYRVWDYPIKEQYNRILAVIKKTGMMKTAEEGFDKVKQDKESTFAFIHDAAEIKYEVYKSCDLTEIGEPFAEQPYAIAVQSGSYLQEEISKVLLDLQKDRYFEQLYNVFWNNSAKRNCPNSDETEGITLQSLGGVFIATLVGLAIGMLTLVGEVLYYKKKRATPIQPIDSQSVVKMNKGSRDTKDSSRTRTINVRPRVPQNRY